jgi:Lar family restriction alleviation protein
MSGEPLLPCPFCGEAEELYPAHHGMGEGEPYAIDCLGCGIDFVPREGTDVRAAWNRRVDPARHHSSLVRSGRPS